MKWHHPDYKQGCTGKYRYFTMRAARARIHAWRKAEPDIGHLQAYWCHHCTYWHITGSVIRLFNCPAINPEQDDRHQPHVFKWTRRVVSCARCGWYPSIWIEVSPELKRELAKYKGNKPYLQTFARLYSARARRFITLDFVPIVEHIVKQVGGNVETCFSNQEAQSA